MKKTLLVLMLTFTGLALGAESYKTRPEPTDGLFVTGTVLHMPAMSFDATWASGRCVDKASLRMETDAKWIPGLGLGYRWKNGAALSGTAFYLGDMGTDTDWTNKPYRLRKGSLSTDESRNDWTFGVTIEIPVKLFAY